MAPFYAGLEIYIGEAKFGEILHFISNEIIFHQLVYHFIIFIHWEIICKEGLCIDA